VEIVLNCLWLLLGLSLIAGWSAHACRSNTCANETLRLSRGLQFTALLLLIVLLLPVISVSDDIAMCTAPGDAERALRLHDPLHGSPLSAALEPAAVAWMDMLSQALRGRQSRPVELDAKLTVPLAGSRLPIDSRPPPATL
jgi:hypothetical protein